jgi:hypothetical protein
MKRQQTIRQLERLALDSHRAGLSWRDYFAANAGIITTIISGNPAGWGEVRDRLLALLVSGETSGRLPVGDSEADQAPAVALTPSDTETAARLQPGIFPQVTQ